MDPLQKPTFCIKKRLKKLEKLLFTSLFTFFRGLTPRLENQRRKSLFCSKMGHFKIWLLTFCVVRTFILPLVESPYSGTIEIHAKMNFFLRSIGAAKIATTRHRCLRTTSLSTLLNRDACSLYLDSIFVTYKSPNQFKCYCNLLLLSHTGVWATRHLCLLTD